MSEEDLWGVGQERRDREELDSWVFQVPGNVELRRQPTPSQMANNINSVLFDRFEELLEMVLLLLPPQDLKSALVVCKSWKKVGERSKFWAWVCLTVTKLNLSEMPQFLEYERFKSLENLFVRAASNNLMLAIERHPKLRKLDMTRCDLYLVDPEILARVVAQMEEVDLSESKHTSQQCEAISRLVDSDSNLRKLRMVGSDLSSVNPETLARIVAQIEEVNISGANPSAQQCQAIFRFAAGDSKLRKLNMTRCNLSLVNPETMTNVVAKLEDVELNHIKLTTHQCEALFRVADVKLRSLKGGIFNKYYTLKFKRNLAL